MNRFLPYLLGPEIYWAVICVIVRLATKRTSAPDPTVTGLLDQYWVVLPLVMVPLTFAFFCAPGAGRWWLLLRIDVAIAIGLAIATTQYCEGMTYHEPSSGPGAGTAWMMMLAFGYMLLVLGTAVAAVVIWWRSRTPV
jgi:hypothetical protein